MSWYRRSSAPGLRGGRRRSSASYALAAGRKCSLSTFAASSRNRSGSKGHLGRDLGDDDIELCQPPLEEMPRIAGYEDITFDPYTVPPPDLPETKETEPREDDVEMEPFRKITHLSKHAAREILIHYADSRCAFNKNTARDMKITGFEYHPVHKYILETFTETRQVAWSFEPYTGGPLDEPNPSLTVPEPWSIECAPPQPFQIHSLILDVPHTDMLMTCHACGGVGSKRCYACSAAGWERCSLCFGDGHKISLQGHRERCFRCLGTGRKKCWRCNGETIAICRGCNGTGQIRCFISLTITWLTHSDSHILEPPEVEEIGHKLEFTTGHVIFDDERPIVCPVEIPDTDLPSVSSSLIEKHKHISSQEKIILQRHSVRTIPVYIVTYEWKQKMRHFFIYGSRNEVYAPEYPEQLCCCMVS